MGGRTTEPPSRSAHDIFRHHGWILRAKSGNAQWHTFLGRWILVESFRTAAMPDRRVVLVVEDELFVRMMAIDAIEDAGYVAVEAGTADEALTLLDRRNDIDVLFSDIKMPGQLDGLGLAAAVRQRWPSIPIILTSGHLYEHDVEMPAQVPFLQKPYRASALIAELARLHS